MKGRQDRDCFTFFCTQQRNFLLVMLLSITQGNAHKGNQAYTTLKGVVLLSKKAMSVCYGGESICDNKSIFLQISSNNA